MGKEKVKFEKRDFENHDKFDYKMAEEFVKEFEENKEDIQDIILNKEEVLEIITDDKVKASETGRQLIPDNLIKLHNEITEEKTKESTKNNLWG